MNDASLSGVIILDKPPGLASNRALGRIRHLLTADRVNSRPGGAGTGKGRRALKLGFVGTLDPLATGVLPVFVGKATKLIPAFEGLEKTYRTTLRLGQRTDTFDAEGTVIAEAAVDGLDEDAVRTAVLGFQGVMEQETPPFSAVKQDGIPAYRLARRGEAAPTRVRTVHLGAMQVEPIGLPHVTFAVTVSAGTYIRRLADDIGLKLGVGAHVTALRRLACGHLFTENKSITLERLEESIARDDFRFVLNPSDFLADYLALIVEEPSERLLRNGRTIPLDVPSATFKPTAKVKAMRPCGTLVAIGEVVCMQPDTLWFQPTKVLV